MIREYPRDRFIAVMHSDTTGAGPTFKQVMWFAVLDQYENREYVTRFETIEAAARLARELNHGV